MSIVDQANATMRQAAAEIERLRAVNAGHQRVIATYCAELDRQIVVIAEMLAALELFTRQWNACGPRSDFGRYFSNVRAAAEAAIDRAKGETFTTGQARNGVAP
jgi:hypothetical protein